MYIVEKLVGSKPARFLAYLFFSLSLFRVFIKSSLFGLFLALMLYFFSPSLFDVKPYSLSELVLWIEDRSEAQKIAIITALLTLFGFILAFWQASIIWMEQKRIEVSLLACEEISEFFSKAWDSVLVVDIYAESLGEVQVELAKDVVDVEKARLDALSLIRREEEFLEGRKKLSRMVVEINFLKSKHSLVLSQHFALMSLFDSAKFHLEQIAELMWFSSPLSSEKADYFLRILSSPDEVDYLEISRKISEHAANGSGASGGLRGALIGRLFQPSVFSLLKFKDDVRKMRRELSTSPDD